VRVKLTLTVLFVCMLAASVYAARPDLALHDPSPDQIYWFIQSGDCNIGRQGNLPANHLDWLLVEARTVINPAFIVLTGSLVDGTNAQENPQPPYVEEWQQYSQIMFANGANDDWLFDLPGSRDAWNDPGLNAYLTASVQGSATGEYRHAWSIDTPKGEYLFLGVSTVDDSGPAYPDEPAVFSEQDRQWLYGWSEEAEQARMLFVFGHNPLQTFLPWEGVYKLYQWLYDYGAAGYGYSHFPLDTLDERSEFTGDLLRVNGGGLGFNSTCQYTLWVIDHDGVSVNCAKAEQFPIVISSPLDAGLGGSNGYAYPLAAGAPSVHVRALACAPGQPASLNGVIEDVGIAFDLLRVGDSPIYQGEFDATGLDNGTYRITVSAEGLQSHTITVKMAEVQCYDGKDNDGDGLIDFPQDSGCASYSDSLETGDRSPIADAGADVTAFVGENVIFNGEESYDPDLAEHIFFEWTIDVENNKDRIVPEVVTSYAYSMPGTYHATLRVTDSRTNSDTDTMTVTVIEGEEEPDDIAEGPENVPEEEDEDADYGWGCGS